MASRLRRVPVLVGKSGSSGAPGRSSSHAFHGPRARHERRAPFLATLADRVHVGARREDDVRSGEPGELGDPQPGLDREGEHGVVAPSGPGAFVAGAEQRVDLFFDEVGEQVSLGPLRRDREHALDRRGVLGMLEGDVGEERMDRREAVVACCHAVVPVALEVLQERGDERCVERRDVEPARWRAGSLCGEAHQELERRLVGLDRVRARGALRDQALGEVALERGGE